MNTTQEAQLRAYLDTTGATWELTQETRWHLHVKYAPGTSSAQQSLIRDSIDALIPVPRQVSLSGPGCPRLERHIDGVPVDLTYEVTAPPWPNTLKDSHPNIHAACMTVFPTIWGRSRDDWHIYNDHDGGNHLYIRVDTYNQRVWRRMRGRRERLR